MGQISRHFTLEELLASPTATAKGIDEQFTPSAQVVENLTVLAQKVLDPVRDLIDAPLVSSSGYRCERLNSAIGGERTSQHLTGCADDITSPAVPVDDLYQKIKESNIAFDQLIIEHDGAGHRWVHISYNNEPGAVQRGECMKGSLRPGGGTDCVPDGHGAFKQA